MRIGLINYYKKNVYGYNIPLLGFSWNRGVFQFKILGVGFQFWRKRYHD